MTRIRAALLAAIFLLFAGLAVPSPAQDVPIQIAQLQGGVIGSIRVDGNQRIEEGTIRSYMVVRPGDPFDPEQLDRSLKTLFATGLFSDVALKREGSVLVVKVAEFPIVNRIAFEGNKQVSDESLRPEVQLRARAVFSTAV
ncbi:MAG: outer membrane protein assembly factor BamA, partial [Alphaproteobacteria bacterium]|nr:outer membrane protein assembly factor BamA [Alphaproteobacteria bacterium]